MLHLHIIKSTVFVELLNTCFVTSFIFCYKYNIKLYLYLYIILVTLEGTV